jgi:hypothetical protein
MARRHGIMNRSGEMICRYLELEEEQFIHFREGGLSSIIENMDPVQFLMPTPETSKVLDILDRSKTMIILNEILNAGSKTIKEFKPLFTIQSNQLQPLFHILVEDIVFDEFHFDFEDFKQTIMHHRILED